jgi:hypothetical protein
MHLAAIRLAASHTRIRIRMRPQANIYALQCFASAVLAYACFDACSGLILVYVPLHTVLRIKNLASMLAQLAKEADVC